MKRFNTAMAIFFLSAFTSTSFAELPTVVEGAEGYDQAQCIAQGTNNCLQSICTTSSDTDCSEKCRKGAENKCRELIEQ
jgi:hypothetical protein